MTKEICVLKPKTLLL